MKPPVLLGMIGVAVGGLAGYNALYVPQERQARLIETQIAQEQATQQTQADLATLLSQIEQFRKRLPPEPDASWLVHDVLALAQASGVQVTTITQEAPQASAQQQVQRLGVNLQFAATYHQIGAFIDRLERASSFIRVDRIDLTKPSDQDGKASVRLSLSTVYLPPPERLGALKGTTRASGKAP